MVQRIDLGLWCNKLISYDYSFPKLVYSLATLQIAEYFTQRILGFFGLSFRHIYGTWPSSKFCFFFLFFYRPYSKMAADLIFFCMHLNWPLKILLNFLHDNEITRANLYVYKRILNRRPFMNKVYSGKFHERSTI